MGRVSIGFFIALLDMQMVAASLQEIGGRLSAGADETAWVHSWASRDQTIRATARIAGLSGGHCRRPEADQPVD